MLSHDALVVAEFVYETAQRLQQMASEGDQANALAGLAALSALADRELPVIRGVIAAQEQAAQAVNLPQRRMRVICAIGVGQPQPHPHPANAHAAPPEQPTPSVA